LNLLNDVVLSWPEETSTNQNLATKIIDVVTFSAGISIFLPNAAKAGTGETILFNNQGSNTFIVKNADGIQILTVSPGTLWQIYLTDNTTSGGSWETLQYGATTSVVNASALAGTGIVAVGTLLSQSVPITTFNSNFAAGVSDRARAFVWTGAAGTLELPLAAAAGNNWFCYMRNSGSGAIVVDPSGSVQINGGATLSFQPGDSAIIATDGAAYYTIGLGKQAIFAFDYTSIDVSGTGNYTLTGSELNRIAYTFTGTLTGNRDIIVPSTVQQYWVGNQTTGAYQFRIKTAAGTGIIVNSGERAIVYSDGTNVVDADTAGISTPVAIADGGTAATTASAARINLGATAIGDTIYTAASPAAVWGALGPAPIGTVDGGTF
jgi:hypothetical protein